ncbi:DUF4352 domain-containing protein [Aurantimicrobium minutum]|uniref:DUF4352 domain-containing protein n=1 Tax=Aurantimicrobium minutum TaxID=708131 RepID=UPI002474DFCE|nr:DUF4352 domain-containing protein [Aurantimicrobium minutum]MDH6239737.1 hypothetical protein [Aurantimicrobium minutum]
MTDATPAKKKLSKKAIIWIVIAAVVLIAIISAASGGSKSSDTASTTTSEEVTAEEPKAEDPATPGIGAPAVDGKFTFTVTAVECGIPAVGSDVLGATAQGQYCRVSLTVENTGNEPQFMFADNQKGFDAEGREFAPDTSAMIYDGEASGAWMKEINPGNTLTGSLLYDIPAGASLTSLELHDSAFSAGVKVNLQ